MAKITSKEIIEELKNSHLKASIKNALLRELEKKTASDTQAVGGSETSKSTAENTEKAKADGNTTAKATAENTADATATAKDTSLSINEEHLLALTADYLNVFVVYPERDSADIIKLDGYVTRGIKDKPKGFSYTKLLTTYINDRVYEQDKESLSKTLSLDSVKKYFSGDREQGECSYRILDKDRLHTYSAKYMKISKPGEELKLVVAFRNIDYIEELGHEKHNEGLFNAYGAISSIFFSLHRVNIISNRYKIIKTTPTLKKLVKEGSTDYDVNSKLIMTGVASRASLKDALAFVDRKTLAERMKGTNHITMEFLSYAGDLCRLHFFREDEDEKGNLRHVVFGVEKVNEQLSSAMINALTHEYKNVFLINLKTGDSRVYKMKGFIGEGIDERENSRFSYDETSKGYVANRVHPDDREAVEKEICLENLRKVFKKEDSFTGIYRILVNGEIHHYRYVFYKLGELDFVVAGFRNIDDTIAQHTREEKAIRDKEQAYQDKIREQLVISDSLARNFKNVYFVDVDEGTARAIKLADNYDNILNIEKEQAFSFRAVLDTWINNIVCTEDRAEMAKAFDIKTIKKELKTKDELTGNYRSVVNGETHYYQYVLNKVRLPGNKVVLGYQCIDDIVHEHKRQEKKQRELENAKNREAQERAEVISSISTVYSTIFRADVDTHHYDILNSVELMMKTAKTSGNFDDVKEKILTAFMAEEFRPHMREFLDLNTIAERLDKVNTVVTEYKNNDGRWFQARFIVKRKDESGKVKEVLYVARESTAEKVKELEVQERLSHALASAQQASKAKSTFLNSMSHDIRTPMNAIIGFTALAKTHINNTEAVSDYLAKISTSSNHLLSLINDILDMSRIESGTVKLDERPVHIPDTLHDLRAMIQGLVNAKNQNLYIDTQDVIHEDVIADKLRLNQVMINIVGNAIKFTKPGGDIIIRLVEKPSRRKHYRTYEFSVKDNGIGMSQEFLGHIFESFTRERSATVSGVQGTGLGMAITKNIVDMMGGTITCESELGKGSLFTVTLELPLANEPVSNEPIPELLGARALVVDDDLDTCKSVSKMLRDIKMRPDWTASGKEAVIRAQEATEIKDEYKVYIIDYLMPDMNGIETVRRIRKVIEEEVPIIVLTAYDWGDLESEAREAGVTAFVSKPLFMSELRRVLTKPTEKLQEEAKKEKTYDYGGKRVLLVEDNELNREIATAILNQANIEVDCATDGTEAVDIMTSAPEDKYDLIFMDIQMPLMDGYTATREIRTLANNKKANIPIVAMTANAFDEDRKKSLEAGMNGHIVKPITIDAIAEVLDKIF